MCRFFLFLRLLARRSTLFPYTTLFRSQRHLDQDQGGAHPRSTMRSDDAASLCAEGAREINPRRRIAWSIVGALRSEEHTSELQSLRQLVCRLLLEKKKQQITHAAHNFL